VYAGEPLIDVMVASSRASRLLHGTCRLAVGGPPRSTAWGCLSATEGEPPSVDFVRGRLRRRAQPARARSVAGRFWVAAVEGRFDQVVVISRGERESGWIAGG
jgi:hypothetical protein